MNMNKYRWHFQHILTAVQTPGQTLHWSCDFHLSKTGFISAKFLSGFVRRILFLLNMTRAKKEQGREVADDDDNLDYGGILKSFNNTLSASDVT
jgi:hypothetical protein